MATNIQEIRKQLKLAGQKLKTSDAEKGCCRIYVDGSAATKSDITKEACQRIANNFPGATFSFHPGQKCSDITGV